MLSDIEIAQNSELIPIRIIAGNIGIDEASLELYGNYKAKISEDFLNESNNKPDGKLILVTAVNPTPAGEGKTTTTVGIGQAMAKIGKNAVVALREPSLGPVFGMKGGAAGGGYAQVIPMEDINLHFTGDLHAITAANNLLCALLDNHMHQGNALKIDQRRVFIKRCVDINDRALRDIVIGLGGRINSIPRQDGFIITVASEVMAILCLAENLDDLKNRLGNILVAYSIENKPVFAKELNAQGAMAALLRDAVKPNLVQTLEGTPAIMHGGPFANIAHGCNSVRATKLAMKLGDYCITEAGFGSDLGAEKFFDIKCRAAGLNPSAVVIVATVRALKYNGGIKKDELSEENTYALRNGMINLGKHIENMKKFGIPSIVALNKFGSDTESEIEIVKDYCEELGARFAISECFSKGGDGAIELANAICEMSDEPSAFAPIYATDMPLKEKIKVIASEIYGADDIVYTQQAEKSIRELGELTDNLPVCMAKTQYSLSDDAALLGRPENFKITVRDITISNGAGFVVVSTGEIMKMPGLPKVPASSKIDVSSDGAITGLF